MRIFHIATLADWRAAQASGTYTTSTRGRTLAEEGFIHASRGDQWQGVRDRFYADVSEPLVLLSIDTELLTSPVVDEEVPGAAPGGETFPHIYGPIDVGAVLTTLPLDDEQVQAPPMSSASFSRLFLREVFQQLLLASLVLDCVVALTLVGLATGLDWGPVSGAGIGLVLGILAARVVAARRTD